MRRIVLALAPLLASCAPATECDDPRALCLSPGTATRTQLALGASALASVDLDGDGHPEVVAAGEGTITVSWGLSDRAMTWSIDQEVAGLAVADLDGDGRLDLATALPRTNAVAVLPGRGGREFGPPARYPAGASPRALIAADLDGVGPPELITAGVGDGTITVLRDLVAGPPAVVGPGPRALAAGDLDGDGDLDLAVALADADAVQVMLGDGRGGLLPGPRHPVGAAPRALAIADLDDDGALDIATADALDDTVSVLYADGAGGHHVRKALPAVDLPTALVALPDAADRPVLAVLSESPARIARIDPRDGQTVFGELDSQPSALSTAAGELHYATVDARLGELAPGLGLHTAPLWDAPDSVDAWPADIDGDGIDELVEASENAPPGTLALRRAGQLVVTGIAPDLDTEHIRGAAAADLTRDGRRDLVVWNDDEAVVLVQQPDGAAFVSGPPLAIDWTVQVGDVDGDGAYELLTASIGDDSTRLRWWTADPAGELTPLREQTVTFRIFGFAVIDGDGNGRADIVLDRVFSLHYLADTSVFPLELAPGSGWNFHGTKLADLDGDGDLDGAGCGETGLTVVRDVLTSAPSTERVGEGTCSAVAIADLDGDGALDIIQKSGLEAYSVRTRFTPHLNRGDRWISGGKTFLDHASSPDPEFAQLDGDGVPDLLDVGWNPGAQAHRLSLGPALVETRAARFSTSHRHCLGDLDGDGATDIVLVGDELAVAFADGRGGFERLIRHDTHALYVPPAPAFESWLEGCLAADLDGDGADELFLDLRTDSSSRAWLASADVGRTGGLTVRALVGKPGPGSRIERADLDEDGALDLVVIAPSSSALAPGLRIFHYPGDGSAQLSAEYTHTDLPAPEQVHSPQLLDIDGDGRLDLVAQTDVWTFVLFPGEPGGTFAPARPLAALQPLSHVFGDFDRDARLDLAAVTRRNRLVVAPLGAGASPRTLLGGIDAVGAADLDHDGRLELLAAGPRSFEPGRTGSLYIGRTRDDGRLGFTAHDIPYPDAPELRIADFDGDGQRDVALIDRLGVTLVRQSP